MIDTWQFLGQNILLRSGDVVFTRGNAIISRLIRWFSQEKGEAKTWTNHVGIIAESNMTRPNIIEAVDEVRRHTLFRYEDKKTDVAVFRMSTLNQRECYNLVRKADTYIGRKYGWWKIIAHALDRRFGNRYIFRRLLFLDKYPICSWLVAHVYSKVVGYDFPPHPDATQPDDMMDQCLKDKERWAIVWTSEPEIRMKLEKSRSAK